MWLRVLGLVMMRSLYKVAEDVGAVVGAVVARVVLDEWAAPAADMAMTAANGGGGLRQASLRRVKKNGGDGGHEGPPAADRPRAI